MSVPGFLSVMSLYLSHGEKEVVLTCVRTWLPSLGCHFFFLSHSEMKRNGFNICLYLAFPLSCLSTYREGKRGVL